MNNSQWCHIHTHNEHSMLDGFGTADNYAKKAKLLGFKYLGLTNHSNIDGLIKHQKACEKHGIKPILGCEFYIVPKLEKKKRRGHIVVLAKNQAGFENICRMLTFANTEGFYYRPRITHDLLLDHCRGTVISTACTSTFLKSDRGIELFQNLNDSIGEDLYCELMPHDYNAQIETNQMVIKIANKYDRKLIVSNDCHYINRGEYKVQEILLAMQRKAKWNDPKRWRFDIRGLHLKTYKEMRITFKQQGFFKKQWFKNTLEIAEKCSDFRIEKRDIKLPRIKEIKRSEEKKYLKSICQKNFKKKWGHDLKLDQQYYERFKEEFKLIKKKKFIRYFLIVWELIKWCKENNILVGPGRGCFTGDTKISLINGENKTIRQLSKEYKNKTFWVYSCLPNGKIVLGKASNARMTKITEKICNVKIDNGQSIKCTPDHKFLMRNGKYREAQHLKADDSLMPLYKQYDNKGYEKFYDNKKKTLFYTHYMGFKYKKGFVIHHLNFNKKDNRPQNLKQFSNKLHAKIHAFSNSRRWGIKEWRKQAIERYWQGLGSVENRIKISKRNKTKSFRQKVSKGQKRIWNNPEYRKKMLIILNSPERKLKNRDRIIKFNKSKKMRRLVSERNKTIGMRIKVSIGRKKYYKTPKGIQEKENIRKRMTGRIVKKSTCKKISDYHTGKTLSDEHKRKLSIAGKGRIFTDEHKRKISQALKRRKTKNHKIVSVSFINKKKIMYDIEVEKYHNFALSSGVFVHNSAGGSLIAFLMRITAVDPIKHKLLFSRFINEDRIDYPDIDIDFEHNKRHIVKKHLEDMYGTDNVAGVSSFNRMKARAVIRNVSRVFEIQNSEVDRFSKLIEDNDENTGIQDAIDSYEEGQEFHDKYPDIIKYAKKLEGQVFGYSQHAAALVVSQENIGESGRCNLLERDGVTLINWEKEDTEYVGLMKLDILGLKLLSVLGEALKLIKENHDEDIDLEKINLNDKQVLAQINEGHTVGIFQIGTWATTALVKDMGVDKFSHISDAVALVRPGPTNSGITKDYIKRKHGVRWEKKHKVYEKIMADTYGLPIYQEQVMSVINKVAGLPYSTADKVRKIIGKKRDKKEFEKHKKQFLQGCDKEKIFDKSEAKEFWRELQEWAKYGFPKAHSVEYAVLAIWCSWLKNYYPTEFICASLTFGADNKKGELVEEAYRLGLTLVLPKVTISDATKWVAKSNKLYIPFLEVKGIGEKRATQAAIQTSVKGIRKFYIKKSHRLSPKHKGKFGELLNDIDSYNPDENTIITEKMKQLFKFRIVTNPRDNYKNLYSLFNDKLRLDKLDNVLAGDYKTLKSYAPRNIIHTQEPYSYPHKLLRCESCELIEECRRPVPPSGGALNIMIIGQDPGYEEDQEGKGFVGRSGDKIWEKVKKKGYSRKQFHITNICKCYPSNSKKGNQEQIKVCTNKWLTKEILSVKPKIILAFGNANIQFFLNRKSGIIDMSGRTTWNEQYSTWIAWCLHPAAILHNPDNITYYDAGMKNFFKLIRILGKGIIK